MKKINYKLYDGTIQEIEVSDEFATSYEQLEREERQAEERDKWHSRKHLTSLDNFLEAGGQIEDPNSNFFELNYEYEELHNAISKLTEEQQKLIKKIFYQGMTSAEIASEKGIVKSAISNRLARIYEQLKKYLITP